jgi:kynureninase
MDMRRVTAAAQRAGAAMVWDLSHSAGVVPVTSTVRGRLRGRLRPQAPELAGRSAGFIMPAGPPRSLFPQPITGWYGATRHSVLTFLAGYEPAAAFAVPERHAVGVGLAALESSVDLILEARWTRFAASRSRSATSSSSSSTAIAAGWAWSSQARARREARQPRVVRHAESYPVMQALIAPASSAIAARRTCCGSDSAPLYLRYADVWHAVTQIARILQGRDWDRPEFRARALVT